MHSRMRSLVTAALLAGAVTAWPTAPAHAGAGSVVKVTGSQGNWQLTVDGSPYLVKGVTWGPSPADAGRLLPDVTSLGANTIRTWGTDASSRQLFDAASANGIKVVAGFWLQPGGGPGSGGCTDYLTDTAYKNNMLAEFSRWVEAYRDHPAVLMWNVGNESVLGLQNCYSGAALENQRNAYTAFVNDVAKAIHRIDANHPVTSTDAWAGAWSYYQRNSPDLDLYSVNSYKEVCGVRHAWEQGGHTKPYLITETGPAGEWEVPDDANGVPLEPGDQAKADGYTSAWYCVTGHRGVALGATVFHYGTEYDFGGHWFNLTPAGERRKMYYAVKRAYGGNTAGDNLPPTVSVPSVDDPGAVPALQGDHGPGPGDRPRGRPARVRGPVGQQVRGRRGRPGVRTVDAPRRRRPEGDRPCEDRRVEAVRQGQGRAGQRGCRAALGAGGAAPGGGHRRGPEPSHDRLQLPERRLGRLPVHPAAGHGRAQRHPLGQLVGRSSVAPGGPGVGEAAAARPAGVGVRVREGVHDQGVGRRPELADGVRHLLR